MKNLKLSTIAAIVGYTMLAAVLSSCTQSAKKEGEIVKDKNGKYYQRTNERCFGHER